MLNQDIATMAYILVHDFRKQLIQEARAETEFDGGTIYRDTVSTILAWAEKEGFTTVVECAQTTLEYIDAETFDVDDV